MQSSATLRKENRLQLPTKWGAGISYIIDDALRRVKPGIQEESINEIKKRMSEIFTLSPGRLRPNPVTC
jgi:hypothetical protein